MYVLTGKKLPLHVGESWRPSSPAERAAAAIQDMKLSKEDGEMLIAMANRLSRGA